MGTDQQSSPKNPGVEKDVAGQGDEGRRNAQAAPDIAEDGNPGQTTHPAPSDDVGVPPDEEVGRD